MSNEGIPRTTSLIKVSRAGQLREYCGYIAGNEERI